MKYVPDVAFVVSLACLAYGCGLAWYPLGWIVPSVVVMVVAFKGYQAKVNNDA